ncbi:tRNA-(guanine-N1)-methyltransferase [Rouxiella silvae]|uniref:tRNA-(Guanine-N1)-methyltransferase n=1 Tax=Rouxiella silvae TaxID=1646373 RepID=A0ABX3TXR0_9GAMM|nr:toxin YdaT family protein [Rouxiella silvae]ORJ19994.1 tRNA-(guanine-N1)-methyltransferase [Rouxiella silvae]
MDINLLKTELESWAAEVGQEHVAIEVSRYFLLLGGGPRVRLHQIEHSGVADWRAINNNRQQIFRWLRGDSRASAQKLQELAPAIQAALPAERRAKLDGDVSMLYLVSIAIREFAAAIIAILLDDRDMSQRLAIANSAMAAMAPVLQLRTTTA